MKFDIPIEIIPCLWFWVVYSVFYETPKKKVQRVFGDHILSVLYDII
jgi:hypothetical protein